MPQFSQSVADLFATLGIDTSKFTQGLGYAKTEAQKAADVVRAHFQEIEDAATRLGNIHGPEKIAQALKETANNGIAATQVLKQLEEQTRRTTMAFEADANKRAREVVTRDVMGAAGDARIRAEQEAQALEIMGAHQTQYQNLWKGLLKERDQQETQQIQSMFQQKKAYEDLWSGLLKQRDQAQSERRKQESQAEAIVAARAKDYTTMYSGLLDERDKKQKAIEVDSKKRAQEILSQQQNDAKAMARIAEEEIADNHRKAREIQAANNKIIADNRRKAADLQSVSQGMMAAGVMMTAAITTPLVGIATAAIQAASSMEVNTVAFTKMTGSAKDAQEHLTELKDFALATPFQFDDVVLADKRLQAMGFTAKEVIPMLRGVGDAAALLGTGAEGVQRITKALSDIRAKGKVEAEEMRQLAEAGIAAREILAEAFGVTIPQLMKMSRQGTIEADQAIAALLAGISRRFAGTMDDQMKTLSGRLSNFKDKITFALQDIGAPLSAITKNVLDFAEGGLAAVSKLASEFGKLPPVLQNIYTGLGLTASAMGPILTMFGTLTWSVSQLLPLLGKTSLTMAGIGIAAGQAALVIVGLIGVVSALALEFDKMREASKKQDNQFREFIKSGTREARTLQEVEFREKELDKARQDRLIDEIFYKEQLAELDKRRDEISMAATRNAMKSMSGNVTLLKAEKKLTEEEYKIKVAELTVLEGHEKAKLQIEYDNNIARLKDQVDFTEERLKVEKKYINDQYNQAVKAAKRRQDLEKQMHEDLKDAQLGVTIGAAADTRDVALNKAKIQSDDRQQKEQKDLQKAGDDFMAFTAKFIQDRNDRVLKGDMDLLADKLKIQNDANEKIKADQDKANLLFIEGELAHDNQLARMKRLGLDLLEAQGKITNKQKMDLLDQLDAAEEEFQRKHTEREIAELEMSKEVNKAAIQALKNRLVAMGDTRAIRQITAEVRNAAKEWSEYQKIVDRAFNNISRSIAKNIIEMKGFGNAMKEIAKDMAQGMLEILIQELLKPFKKMMIELVKEIEDTLIKPLLNKLKKILIDIFTRGGGGAPAPGGGGGGGVGGGLPLPPTIPMPPMPGGTAPPIPTVPGPGGGGGGVGGTVGGIAGGAIGGWVSLISGAVTAVSSVVGNFQMAGMNKSLDVIVNHTLRTFNEVFQQRIDHWTQHNQLMVKLDDMWNAIREVGGGGGGPVTINVQGITNLDQFVRELKARGFVIAPM